MRYVYMADISDEFSVGDWVIVKFGRKYHPVLITASDEEYFEDTEDDVLVSEEIEKATKSILRKATEDEIEEIMDKHDVVFN